MASPAPLRGILIRSSNLHSAFLTAHCPPRMVSILGGLFPSDRILRRALFPGSPLQLGSRALSLAQINPHLPRSCFERHRKPPTSLLILSLFHSVVSVRWIAPIPPSRRGVDPHAHHHTVLLRE
ncbi:hypothetical protein FNV43_RR06516 [Rhamnella rubrinervis]|uniref:Uncharacterized protein n=1 Tax=Rhamnella rubrinervis TaxID=2594499 RepID=A0A8K0HEP7_9ROSA|nr:hypothetical protein FNV43_RR06516 [Rhamnella rubrinervis]